MPIFNPILVGKQLPTLTTPGAASDLASGKQLIGQDGEIVTGNVPVVTELSMTGTPSVSGSNLVIGRPSTMRAILPYQVPVKMDAPLTSLGDAAAADVASGKTFTSTAGVKVTGTAQIPQICTVTIKVEQTVGDPSLEHYAGAESVDYAALKPHVDELAGSAQQFVEDYRANQSEIIRLRKEGKYDEVTALMEAAGNA